MASAQSTACICCGGERSISHFRALRKCESCGYVWADVRLDAAEILRLYSEEYFRGEEYADYPADARTHQRNFAARFANLKRIAPNVRSVFEIGCAYGFWLAECSKQGLRAEGVDVCPEAVQHAVETLGQKASVADFVSMPMEPGRFDAFCMWDTIEHLAHPEDFIARVQQMLSPGGWLFLTTGDIGAMFARMRGPRWRLIHPPTHLHYFSTATMRLFLQRHGFEVVSIRSTAFYRNIGETLSRMATLGTGFSRIAAKGLSRVVPGFVQRGGFWLDLGDIMCVAARKL
jgi:SAM-dependent methyltransferase